MRSPMEERPVIVARCPGCSLPFDPIARNILANSLVLPLGEPVQKTHWRCEVCGQVAWSRTGD